MGFTAWNGEMFEGEPPDDWTADASTGRYWPPDWSSRRYIREEALGSEPNPPLPNRVSVGFEDATAPDAPRLRQAPIDRAEAIITTTGERIEGRTISRHRGVIGGDATVSLSRGKDGVFTGPDDVSAALRRTLPQLRRTALANLRNEAVELGCHAVIGVDVETTTLDPQTANSLGGTTYLPYVICVTATGTSVTLKPAGEPKPID